MTKTTLIGTIIAITLTTILFVMFLNIGHLRQIQHDLIRNQTEQEYIRVFCEKRQDCMYNERLQFLIREETQISNLIK